MNTDRTALRVRQVVLIVIILLELWGLISALAGPTGPAATPVGVTTPAFVYATVDLGGPAAHEAQQGAHLQQRGPDPQIG